MGKTILLPEISQIAAPKPNNNNDVLESRTDKKCSLRGKLEQFPV
jgi:hypothetical protein